MVQIKTAEQVDGIRAACNIVALAHQRVREKIAPGMSTYQIDNIVKHTLRDNDAKSAFYKYSQGGKKPFPAHACISVNEEIVHGIGNHTRILKEEDLITIDVGANLNGFIGDAAITILLGEDEERNKLNECTKAALMKAIEQTKEGAHLFDICEIIQQTCAEGGYGLITNYFGHGVGLQLHEAPQIPNFRPSTGHNLKLRAGMTITYEPMFTLGSNETEELDDGWTVVTKDRSYASHWEHTILVTENGAEILTELPIKEVEGNS